MLQRTFDEVKSEVSGVSFTDVDVDINEAEAIKYGVSSIPLVVIEKNGQIVKKIQGSQPKSTYVNAINEYR